MQMKYKFYLSKIVVVFLVFLITGCGLITEPAIIFSSSQDFWECNNYNQGGDINLLSGPEDIAVDFKKPRVFISSTCDGEEQLKRNCGGLFLLKENEIRKIPVKDNDKCKFDKSLMKPHGISLYQSSDNPENSWLFVINHENNEKIEDFVDIFKIDDTKEPILTHFNRIKSGNYSGFNDLVAVSDNQFCVTSNGGQFSQFLSVLGWSMSEVLFYNGKNYKSVKSDLSFANGIARGHNKLYVTTTFSKKLYSWDEISLGQLNLASEVSIPLGTGLDNIHWKSDKKEAFFITGHNSLIKFLKAKKKLLAKFFL